MAQSTGKGFTKGIEAMRTILVREFKSFGRSTFTGEEVAHLIQQAPGPIAEMKQEDLAKLKAVEAEEEIPAGVPS